MLKEKFIKRYVLDYKLISKETGISETTVRKDLKNVYKAKHLRQQMYIHVLKMTLEQLSKLRIK